jgi:hypothetical protein
MDEDTADALRCILIRLARMEDLSHRTGGLTEHEKRLCKSLIWPMKMRDTGWDGDARYGSMGRPVMPDYDALSLDPTRKKGGDK